MTIYVSDVWVVIHFQITRLHVDATRHSVVVAGWYVCIVSLIIVHCTPFVVPYISDIMKIKMYYNFNLALKFSVKKLKSFWSIQFLDTYSFSF